MLVVALVWLPHDGGGRGERVSSSTLTPEHLRLGQRAVLAAPGEGPTLLARTAGSLWAAGGVANRGATTLFELDPASGAVRARVKVPGRVVSIAPGFGSLWLAVVDPDGATGRGEIVRVDPTTRRTVATIELGDADPARHGRGRGVGHRRARGPAPEDRSGRQRRRRVDADRRRVGGRGRR